MPSPEQRLWNRLSPAANEIQLKTRTGVVEGEVCDVSFGGVAVTVKRKPSLVEGDLVDVCWRGSWMRGVVCYHESADDGFRVGLEWTKSRSAAQ